MRVILFGATGMVGSGVLRECLRDEGVEQVLVIGRSATGIVDPKLRELVVADMFDTSAAGDALRGYDACFFCLGVSAAGMSEADYTHLTFDLTLAWARALAAVNPEMTFLYVSGAGTGGKAMWARVNAAPRRRCWRSSLRHPWSAWPCSARCTARRRRRDGRASRTQSSAPCCRSSGSSRPAP